MNQSDLEQLPAEQKKNALLAIALGYGFEIHPLWEMLVILPSGVGKMLDVWKPDENKALMWDLVCELRNVRTILFTDTGIYSEYHGETESYLSGDISCDLIAAYISADPKGNIAKFYLNKGEGKENEPV